MPHFLTRAALLAASAAVLAACASTQQYSNEMGGPQGTGAQVPEMRKPEYSTRLPQSGGQTPGEQTSQDDAPAPQAQPSTEVESSQLSPVSAAPSTGSVEVAQLDAPPATATDTPRYRPTAQPEYQPEPEPEPYRPPAPPRTETRTTTSVSGKVVDVDGRPKSYKVKSGQGLDAVAREMGTTRKQLAADNDLKEPYRLKPGQTLKGPASRAKAYVVGSGDTLYAIARRFTVSAAALAGENDMEIGDAIRPGQKLKLPPGYKDTGPVRKTVTVTLDPEPAPPRPTPPPYRPPPVATSPATPPTTTPPPVTRPPVTTPPPSTRPPVTTPSRPPYTPPPTTRPPATPPTTTTRPPYTPPPVTRPATPPLEDEKPPNYSDADYVRMAAGRFAWPVRGTVVSSFGPQAGGQRNDGLDIGASAGTPVRASADGIVVLANEIPNSGLTVMIRHADGWFTVYTHLQREDVEIQGSVTKGQQIGLVGSSGDAPRPQLHFEIRHSPSSRYRAKAIDPALLLPR